MRGAIFLLGAAVVFGCSASENNGDSGSGGRGGASSNGGSGGSGNATSIGGGGGLTVGPGTGGSQNICKVNESGDAVPDCDDSAPAESFSPMVQWDWTAPVGPGSLITPLVGNFTDDNGDGAVDLCDIPDVVVTTIDDFANGKIYVLSGDNGAEHFEIVGIDPNVTPAFGDIDGDGLPEIVAADPAGHLVAFENTGAAKWTSPVVAGFKQIIDSYCTAISIYDLMADGSPEIIVAFEVFDNQGQLVWGVPGNGTEFMPEDYWCPTSAAADLDGDGHLEVLFGHKTYHADGTLYWQIPGRPGHPHVANFDADPEPEVLVTSADGMTLVQANGQVTFQNLKPTDPNPSARCWGKPGVVHDFDGDGDAEFATGTCSDYSVYQINPGATVDWSSPVSDLSGLATGTAFDFLGDGVADAIYADEHEIYVYEGATGMQEMTAPRESGTLIEFPVVADVDNDGSAEIVVVSNYLLGGAGPTVVVLRDAMDRWIPARRIWNQHSYHVTNVREDSTIPAPMKNNWQLLNTFRTNSQIGANGDCNPPDPR